MPRRPTPHYPTFAKQSMFLGPAWVWQRAFQLVDCNRNVSLSRDGPDIARVMRYLRAGVYGYSGHWSSHRRDDPDIHAAVEFSEELGQTSNTSELRLKCNVLAGRSIGWLATAYGVSQSVMRTYLKTFFDVKDRLGQRQYILHRVIKLSPSVPPGGCELAQLHAYTMGPEAVEQWMDWFLHANETHDLGTPEGRQREAISIAVETQWLELSRVQSIRLQILHTKCPDIKTKMFRTRRPGEQLLQIQAARIESLRFRDARVPESTESSVETTHSFPSCCQSETVGVTG